MPRPLVKQAGITFGYCDTKTGQRVYPPPAIDDPTFTVDSEPRPEERKPAGHSGYIDDMYLNVTCTPSLGQTTPVARGATAVRFVVLVEASSPSRFDSGEPQVCVWHNHRGVHEWSELPLTPSNAFEDVLLLNRPVGQTLTRTWFVGELSGVPQHSSCVHFTVKFKVNPAQAWRWVRDSTGVDDGELNYLSSAHALDGSRGLQDYFSNISNDIDVQVEKPETDQTSLFSLSCSVKAAVGQDSSYQRHRLGVPRQCSKWFAVVRLWAPWLAPRQGKEKFQVDKDAVLTSFQRSDGLHVVCLGISGLQDTVTVLTSDADGNVVIQGRNDSVENSAARVLVAVAENFEVANAAVFYHARKMIKAGTVTAIAEDDSATDGSDVKPEWLEEWQDGLTYCTWNSLGQKLTADKIYDALDDLAKNNINITNLIIDDNWQSLNDDRGWSEFEANSKGFPEGMKTTTNKIRQQHPHIRHIAVWHAILGYWGGIDPKGKIAARYKTQQVEIEPGAAEGQLTVVAAEDVKAMYNDFYTFLAASGVDSVKTDAQNFLDMLYHAPDRRSLIFAYEDAWTVAYLRHFSSRAISCMSQTPQALFHNQLPTNKPRLLVRNSDDFFPDIPASHPWHIFCNAHNSLFMQHLNVLPDWDMFQTSHPWAAFHAAARCVSGGPIYITDTPGKHDLTLIGQMTAQTTTGNTVILRPHCIGKSINPYNAYDSRSMLKIGTYVGMARTGAGILGVFNVTNAHQSEIIALADFPGTEEGEYVIGSFSSGQISSPFSIRDKQGFVALELETQSWDILTAYAVRRFEIAPRPIHVAVMGLLNKMTGCAAITGYTAHVETNGHLRIWVALKGLGVLGVWISDLPDRSIEDEFMILLRGQPIPVHCVKRNQECDRVLEIDIASAWQENKEEAGWSNEVSLEIFMHTRRNTDAEA